MRFAARARAMMLAVALALGVAPPTEARTDDPEPLMTTSAAIVALGSGDPATRESAATALAVHAEAGDAAAISALIGLLDAAPPKLRYHAEWGLARAGGHAVPALRDAFRREADDSRRARLAHALGRIGLAARAAAPELIAALDEPHSETAPRAAYALGAMRVREALPALVATYAAGRRLPSQREVAGAIAAIGSDQSARRAREALVASVASDLQSPKPEVRSATLAYVVDLIRLVGRDAPTDLPPRAALAPIVRVLENALASQADPALETLQLVRALGWAGGDAAAAVPTLEALLSDPQHADEAARALAAIATSEAKRILADRAAYAALEQRVRSEYSVQDHQGRMRLLPFQVVGRNADGVHMEARFLYSGDRVQRPTHVVVYFESYSAEPRFQALDEVEWSADGARIVMSDLDRRLSDSQLGVIEGISGRMPVERFEALVAAGRVGARLAPLRFEVSAADLAALRHFASKIPVPAAPLP